MESLPVPILPTAVYTREEAATVCRVSVATLRRAQSEQHLSAAQTNPCRYLGSALLRWLRNGAQTGRNKGDVRIRGKAA